MQSVGSEVALRVANVFLYALRASVHEILEQGSGLHADFQSCTSRVLIPKEHDLKGSGSLRVMGSVLASAVARSCRSRVPHDEEENGREGGRESFHEPCPMKSSCLEAMEG